MKTEILFAKYKDTPVKNKKKFQLALKEFANEIDVGDLWTRIQNYQIDKYGEPISLRVKRYTTYEKGQNNERARKRKYSRREHRW